MNCQAHFFVRRYRALARQHSLWLSLGGYHERLPDEERVSNTHVILNAEGATVAEYRKMCAPTVSFRGNVMRFRCDFQDFASKFDGEIDTPLVLCSCVASESTDPERGGRGGGVSHDVRADGAALPLLRFPDNSARGDLRAIRKERKSRFLRNP